MLPEERTEIVRARAAEMGFDWFGVAKAERLDYELARFREWLSQGRAGDMDWLGASAEKRADPDLALPGARSVLMLGMNYQTPDEPSAGSSGLGKVARYARGRDYHNFIDKKLKRLSRFVRTLGDADSKARSFVDLGALMERPWAARAGLGFIGKNTLLISPEDGSFHFLGAVITTVELAPTISVSPGSCGDCRRCIDACPTGAITEPYVLDARLCLSYLTIEKKGVIDQNLWPRFDGWVFGCDVCQDVCPFNRKRARPAALERFTPMVPAEWSLVEMLRLTESQLSEQFQKSPVTRAGVDSLARNAAIVASERGGDAELAELDRISGNPARPEWLRETARLAVRKIRDYSNNSRPKS